MFLGWVRQGVGPAGKHQLMVVLGERGGKMVALIASSIPEDVITVLKGRNKLIDEAPVETVISWIREIWPGYSAAYREIYNSNAIIERRFTI